MNRLKRREPWRPLAPSVLAGRAAESFDGLSSSPFMLFAVPVRPGMRARIPAVVHVDGSARPQAVTREANPRFHALLHAFAAHTGVPVLLNTSFNVAGEPRVCRPPEAVAAAVAMPLDALVLGDFLALPA